MYQMLQNKKLFFLNIIYLCLVKLINHLNLITMKTTNFFNVLIGIVCTIAFSQCSQKQPVSPDDDQTAIVEETVKSSFGGFDTQEKWGEHLVTICGCNDCHTPKKMTAMGPDIDSSLLLSGHPSQLPVPDVDRIAMEKKGLIVTNDLTTWVGPWGVSFTANLTSDPTGIGNWQESNFFTAIRHGKFKGIESSRSLLPPMPWQMLSNLTDDELRAIFAFLKSTKPIHNVVPEFLPPALAAK